MTTKRINRDKLRQMKRILKTRTLIPGKYLGASEGETCALGALALEAGVSPTALRCGNGSPIYRRPGVSSAIEGMFGLTVTEQMKVQKANDLSRKPDCPYTAEGRYSAVVSVLEDIYKEQ